MKHRRWRLGLGLSLIGASILLFALQYLIFRDSRNLFFYMFQDFAFLPLSVLFVTLILTQFLGKKEKDERLSKMNMVIGAFFAEVGTELVRKMGSLAAEPDHLQAALLVKADWNDGDFARALGEAKSFRLQTEIEALFWEELKPFLLGKRGFLLALLENPNLLEHDSFTELLWAVFHLADELGFRRDFRELPLMDRKHLAVDLERAWQFMILGWLNHMKHLRHDYPYLYSLAVRVNPFDPNSQAEIG